MVEKVVRALIHICVIVGLVYLCIWVLGMIGLALPAMIVKIIWVIAVLVIILVIWRTFGQDLKTGL